MDRAEANARFMKADELYHQGAYNEALVILDDLDAAFPGAHRLMRARAETLAKMGRTSESLEICERLLGDLHYEKIRPLRDRLLAQQGATPSFTPPALRESAEDADADAPAEPKPRRFKIKPIRLLILLALITGMYYDYIPYWLGGGVIVGYFVIRWAIGRAILKLFTLPFRMKAQALAGATAEVHGVHPAPVPPPSDGEDDEEEKPAQDLRWLVVDVTIMPKPRTQGFTMWEPGELYLAPASMKVKSLDDIERCFQIHELKIVEDGQEIEDEGMKYGGPQRIKMHVGVPKNESALQFVYYTESFGRVEIPNGI